MRIVALVFAALWTIGFTIGAIAFFSGGERHSAMAAYLSQPPEPGRPGEDVRIEGVITGEPNVRSPHSQRPCVAALMHVYTVQFHENAQGEWERWTEHLASKHYGPDEIEIQSGGERFVLSIDRWQTGPLLWQPPRQSATVTPDWQLSPTELAASAGGYDIQEYVLEPGPVFVAAHLDDRRADGRIPLSAHPMLGRLEIDPGTHRDYIAVLDERSTDLRVGGYVFLGVALFPLMMFGLMVLIGRTIRRRAPAR